MLNLNAHFLELKLKIYYSLFSFFITFLISYFLAPNLINILSYPFLQFVKEDDSDFVFNSIFEVFSTYYILAFYSSCFFTVPFVLYSLITYIKTGLFEYEKKTIFFLYKLFFCSALSSSLFTYYVIFPILLSFLLNLELITNTNFVFIKMEIKIYDYIVFLSKSLLLYCFVIFQTPMVLFIFAHLKRPNFEYMVNKRRIWVLFCLLLGCLFSSPDLISLFVVSIPFIVFFEIFIFLLILKRNYKSKVLSINSCRELLEW